MYRSTFHTKFTLASMYAPMKRMDASNTCINRGLSLPGSEIAQDQLRWNMLNNNKNTSWLGIVPKIEKQNRYKWLDRTEFGK